MATPALQELKNRQRLKAFAHKAALEELWSRPRSGPMTMHRNGLTLVFDAEPELLTDNEGNIIGIDAMIRAFRGAREIKVDPHRRFFNPPTWHEGKNDPLAAYEQILFDSVNETPYPKGWRTKGTVSTFFSSDADGYLQSSDSTYSTARTGGSISTNTTSVDVGQYGDVAVKICYEGFISFDTSAIADSDVISAVALSLDLDADDSGVDFTINARLRDWGATLTTGDWVSGASLSSLTLLATLNTSAISGSAYQAFTSQSAFAANISKTGVTGIILSSSRHEAGNVPSGTEVVSFQEAETDGSSTTRDPKLVVTHEAVQTLSPTGVSSSAAFGSPTAFIATQPTGIASSEAFGGLTISNATQYLQPTAISAPSSAIGQPYAVDPLNPALRSFELHSYLVSGSGEDVLGESIRFLPRNENDASTAVLDGLEVPNDGEYTYGYVKNFKVNLLPIAHDVTDVKMWLTGRTTAWNGVDICMKTTSAFINPVTTGQAAIAGFANDASTYTAASPLSFDIDNDWLHLQARVRSDARPGVLPPLTLHVTWKQDHGAGPIDQSETLDIDLVAYPNDEHINDALSGRPQGSVHEDFRMYLVDHQGNREEDITRRVLNASIQMTRANTVARTATFELDTVRDIDFETVHFMPVYVLSINGVEIEFPQGIFHGEAPDLSYTEKDDSGSITASDLGIHFAETIEYPITMPKGANYIDAVRTIVSLVGDFETNFEDTTEVLPNDMTWNPGTAWMTIINDLLLGCNYYIARFDRNGVMFSRARELLAERESDVVYASAGRAADMDPTYIVTDTFSTSQQHSDFRNQVVIQVNDPLRAPFWSSYYIEDDDSPIVLPHTFGIQGWTPAAYLTSPDSSYSTSQQATALTPAKLVSPLPRYPSENFPLSGALSVAAVVDLDVTKTQFESVCGIWNYAESQYCFQLATGSSGPVFRISNDGSSYRSLQLDMPPTSGPYLLTGVYSPGGALEDNLLSNGGFESGSAPGTNWWSSQYNTAFSTSFEASDVTEGSRALKVDFAGGNATGVFTFLLSSTVSASAAAGKSVKLSFDYKITGASSSGDVLTIYVRSYYSELSEIIGSKIIQLDSTDSDYVSVEVIMDVPSTSLGLFILGELTVPSGPSDASTVLFDNFKLEPYEAAAFNLQIDAWGEEGEGYTDLAEDDGHEYGALWDGADASTNTVFRIGYTGLDASPFASWINQVAVYYGAITDNDRDLLVNRAWPVNIPYCIAYWHMDDRQGNPVNDYASRGHTLYPVGSLEYRVDTEQGWDRFKAQARVIDIPRMVSQAFADDAAEMFAEEESSQFLTGTLVTTIDPRREVEEIYYLDIVNNNDDEVALGKWVVEGWQMDLRVGGRMTHTLKRVEAA